MESQLDQELNVLEKSINEGIQTAKELSQNVMNDSTSTQVEYNLAESVYRLADSFDNFGTALSKIVGHFRGQ